MKEIKKWMMEHRWRVMFLQLAIIFIVFMGVRSWQMRDAISGQAPNIQGRLLNGQQVDLSQYSGRPVLIYFWASWCPICKITSDSVNSIAEDYNVITIASWSGDVQLVQNHIRETELTMPVIVDEEGKWAERYGVRGVPANFIIDAAGEIQFIESGYTTEYGLRSRLWWLTNVTNKG